MFSRISNFPLLLLFLIHSEFSKLCLSHLFNPYISANLLFSNCLLASAVHFSVPSMRSVLFFSIFTLMFGFLSLEVISRLTLGPLPVSLFFHAVFNRLLLLSMDTSVRNVSSSLVFCFYFSSFTSNWKSGCSLLLEFCKLLFVLVVLTFFKRICWEIWIYWMPQRKSPVPQLRPDADKNK